MMYIHGGIHPQLLHQRNELECLPSHRPHHNNPHQSMETFLPYQRSSSAIFGWWKCRRRYDLVLDQTDIQMEIHLD